MPEMLYYLRIESSQSICNSNRSESRKSNKIRANMKILVLADIHSNWPALAAIDESFDACLFSGDLVDYGPDPINCIEWVRSNVTALVRGNHDHAVAQRVPAKDGSGFRKIAASTRPLHWDMIDPARMKYLSRMPVTENVVLGDSSYFLVHGTPRDPMDEYLTADPKAWESRLKGVDADYVLVGHTHTPFHLDLGRIQVINPGSVGQPRDGDPRCSYVIIEDGQIEFKRVEYDVDKTIRQLKEIGVTGDALALSEVVLKTGGKSTDE